jgi:hypothetical protein
MMIDVILSDWTAVECGPIRQVTSTALLLMAERKPS